MRKCDDISINFLPVGHIIQTEGLETMGCLLHNWLKMSNFYFKTLPIEDIMS
jgi:hypothetical protein